MKLIWQDITRPQDKLVVNDRLDGDIIINSGEVFEVEDDRGRYLLAHYYPRVDIAEPVKVERDSTVRINAVLPLVDSERKEEPKGTFAFGGVVPPVAGEKDADDVEFRG